MQGTTIRLMDEWADELKNREKHLDNFYLSRLRKLANGAHRNGNHSDEMCYMRDYAVALYARGNLGFAASVLDKTAQIALVMRDDAGRAVLSSCAALLYEKIGDPKNAAYAQLRAAESYAFESVKKGKEEFLEYAKGLFADADRLFEDARIKPETVGTRTKVIARIDVCRRSMKRGQGQKQSF